MRCNNCGWKNPDGAKVCEKCSEPLVPVDLQIKQETTDPLVVEETPSVTVEIVNCPKCGYPVKSEDVYCPNCGAVVNRRSSGTDDDMDNRKTCIMARESAESVEAAHSAKAEVKYPSQPKFGNATVREGFVSGATVVEKFAKTEEKSGKSTVREIPDELMDAQEQSRTIEPARDDNSTGVSESVPDVKPVPVKESDTIKSPGGFKLIPADFICGSDAIEFSGDKVSIKRSNVAPGNIAVSEDPAHAEIAFEDGHWYIRDMSGRNATFVVAKNRIMIEPGDEIIIGNKKFLFSE